MNRSLTALFAAFEALLVVAIGVAIPLAPLTILWGAQFGFAIDWSVFWRASADIWLIGHGVDVTITLAPDLAAALGLDGAATPFLVSIAALGFALLTVLLGVRAGRRVAETRHRVLGEIVSVGTFAVLSLLVVLSAQYPSAMPSRWQGVLLPTLIFAVGVAIGSLIARRQIVDERGSSLRDWIDDWRPDVRAVVAVSLRGGAMAVSATLTVAAILVALLLLFGYADIIALYEGLQAGVLGGVSLTLAQLAFLPNIVIWAASWLIGPGFAIGTGSVVSPLGTALGPIPAVPILGALPTGDSGLGFLGLLVPVVFGFLCGAVLRPRLVRQLPVGGGARWPLVATGAGMGIIAGILLGILAAASAGAAGPGRLADVGPEPLLVGLWVALEVGLAAIIGMLAGKPRRED